MSRRPAALLALPLALLQAFFLVGVATAQAAWPDRLTNPRPADDDLLLPAPCGGSMAFRRIDTPVSANWLDDRRVTLGAADAELAYSEYVRVDHLAGSLSGGSASGRFFYLGKYEVTRDQYQAVMEDTCPEPSMRGRLPVTGLSWFDGVAFAQRYTEWLLAEAPDSLPQEGDRRAFLRLPTEAEWEFAARGGVAVSEEAFRRRLFPMQGGIADYAWHQGTLSANGTVHPVGLLAPNPLLLYDMLGNAEELVFEPYRMNRVGRPHGQTGGFLTKGGSFRTPADALRASMRIEYSYYDEARGAATRLDSVGLRIAVGAPVHVSLQRTREYREAWAEIPSFRIDTSDLDPVTAIDRLVEASNDAALADSLRRIQAEVRSELAVRNEVERRAVGSAILAGAALIRKLRDDDRTVRGVEIAFDAARQMDDPQLIERHGNALRRAREAFDISVRAYTDILLQTAGDYGEEILYDQLAAVQGTLRGSGLDSLAAFARLFTRQAVTYRRDPTLDLDRLLREIVEWSPQ